MSLYNNRTEILLLIEEKVTLKRHLQKHKKNGDKDKVTRIKKQIEELQAQIEELSQ